MLNNDLCSAIGLSWSRCRGRAGNAAERDHRGLGGGSTPIIQSLLDIDFYKFTMGHWVFKCYPTVPVRYVFKNRTARVRLADYIDEAELRVNASELHYLRGTNEYGERIYSAGANGICGQCLRPPIEEAIKRLCNQFG